MAARLKLVTDAGEAVRPRWRRPGMTRKHLTAAAVLAVPTAVLVLPLLETRWPSLRGYVAEWIGVLIGVGLFIVWSFGQRPSTIPEGAEVTYHVHVHRRWAVLLLALLPLLGAPSPARADLSPGDLSSAVSDLADKLLDALCAFLLMPQPSLPVLAPPAPLPAPPTGNHVAGLPTTVDAAGALADQLAADRQRRVEAADAAAQAAATASAQSAATLQTLSGLNMDPPVSVAAGAQIGNAATIAGAQATATTNNLLAQQMSLEADRASQEAAQQQRAKAWAESFYANGMWTGVKTWQPDTITMPW